MKLLELFSGTHSIGKVAKELDIEVISLDRDLPADIKIDIMDWDYKIYPSGYFDIITASPVCLWWSYLRLSHINRKLKSLNGEVLTRELIQKDIDTFGKPMVDKVKEIIDYFKPKYYWIENPFCGSMKSYITDLPFYDIDYCMYSNWGYKKRTRFWTNIIGFKPKLCNNQCENIDETTRNNKKPSHSIRIGNRTSNKSTTLLERYRIPPTLIKELLLLTI
jgi:hypothetical protein